MFSISKSDYSDEIDLIKESFKNLKKEVDLWFDEKLSANPSNKCLTKREELNLKHHYQRIIDKVKEYEVECLADNSMFEKLTIFFLNKNNCVSNYMLNRKYPFKLVIIKNEHLNTTEIQSLKQKRYFYSHALN